MSSRLRELAPVALTLLLCCAPPSAAQGDDEYYEDDGITQTVARLAWFEGDVSFNRSGALSETFSSFPTSACGA